MKYRELLNLCLLSARYTVIGDGPMGPATFSWPTDARVRREPVVSLDRGYNRYWWSDLAEEQQRVLLAYTWEPVNRRSPLELLARAGMDECEEPTGDL